MGRLVFAAVVVAVDRGAADADVLEEHRAEIHAEQMDLLVDVVYGHLVHRIEMRKHQIARIDPRLRPRPARIDLPGPGLLGIVEHRLERLPPGQMP